MENLCGWCEGDKKEEAYCVGWLWLSLTESLLSVSSIESFSARRPLYMLAWMFAKYKINKLLSYITFNVTGNKAAEERVYTCRQPDLEWSKAFLSSLLDGKAKDCRPEVLWRDKKYTSASCGHLPTFWKITDFCQTPQPETEHLSMGDNHPQSLSEREREREWEESLARLWSCDIRHHVLFILQDIAHLSS